MDKIFRDYIIDVIAETIDEYNYNISKECIEEISNNVICAFSVKDQVSNIPDDYRINEINRLKKELKKESDKYVCSFCKGTGDIYDGFCISDCSKCSGKGFIYK
jgi:hypothetical protein